MFPLNEEGEVGWIVDRRAMETCFHQTGRCSIVGIGSPSDVSIFLPNEEREEWWDAVSPMDESSLSAGS